ncbi:MAG: tetratricopeptide repeat protein [Spirochaetaceae bacterium]|nr:tetratricopeptide repeat protein [Spirochaetaceae bacterium]
MKKIILFCAVFFLSFSLLNAQTTEVEKWTIRGDEYYDAKDYQNAIKAYTQVINIRLEEEERVKERAKANARAMNRDIYQFNRTWTGLEINAYLYRGKSYYRMKNYDAAIEDYLVVRDNYDPNFYQIYVSLGDAYGANMDYENARINYKKYVEKKPSSESVGFNVDKTNTADMWFCAVLWEKKLLSDDQKYEKWLNEIVNKNSVTLHEIESFYKKNRGW